MRSVLPALALSLFALQAQAAPPLMKTPAESALTQRFQAANTTHDGHLTKEQAQAGHMDLTVRNFDAIDKYHKGYVTMDDLTAYARAHRNP